MQSINPGDSLQIKLGGPTATRNPSFWGSYVASSNGAVSGAVTIPPTVVANATPVNIVGSPPTGFTYYLANFSMSNIDTAAIVVSILLNGTAGITFTLQPGDVLQYAKASDEWAVKGLNGATKQSLSLNWGQIGGTLASQTDLQSALDAKANAATTVAGHALTGNVTLAPSDVSLGNVTNDAQTKAAVVPNTAPAAGQLMVGNAGGTAYAPVAMSGAITMTSAGVTTAALATPSATGAMSAERFSSTQDQNWAEADIFGREYLYAWLVKLMAGSTPVIDLAGDSTTSGTGVDDANYLLDALITNFMTSSYPAVTVYNDGVTGTTTAQWVSTYLTAQIARSPDLMIIRYGLNDAANGLATFTTALRAGLAQIRASRSVSQTAILLMTPNSTNDTPNSRDETWHLAINSVIRQAARDYLCCFADTYTFCRDSANAAPWMDNPYGDGRHIHPDKYSNNPFTQQNNLQHRRLSRHLGLAGNRILLRR